MSEEYQELRARHRLRQRLHSGYAGPTDIIQGVDKVPDRGGNNSKGKGMPLALPCAVLVIVLITLAADATRSRYALVRQGFTTTGHKPSGVLGPGCLCSEPLVSRRASLRADLHDERSEGRAFFERHAMGSTLVVMMCNGAQTQFVDNLVCSLRQNEIDRFVIFATGPEAYRAFKARGYPVYYNPDVVGEDLPENSVGAAGGAVEGKLWRRLLRARLDVALFVLNMGMNIMFLDTDVVVETNVLPEMESLARGVDGVFLWDGPTSGRRYPAFANAGFYLVRATEGGVRLFEEVKALSATGGAFDDDQEIINQVLARSPPVATFELLDRYRYLNGHTLKGHVNWPGHKWKTSKGPPVHVPQDTEVAAVHVNWTGVRRSPQKEEEPSTARN